jgi:hypothetical protein
VGVIAYVQGAAAWFTVKVSPAMVSVPLRAPAVLAATLNWTEPLPVPFVPDVMLIHEAFDAAVHPHPLLVDTATGLPPPPAAAID